VCLPCKIYPVCKVIGYAPHTIAQARDTKVRGTYSVWQAQLQFFRIETVILIDEEDFCAIITPKNHMLQLIGITNLGKFAFSYSLVRKTGIAQRQKPETRNQKPIESYQLI
jgi:hypothetical protein